MNQDYGINIVIILYILGLGFDFLFNLWLIDKIVDAHNENNLKMKWMLIYTLFVINVGLIIFFIK